MKRFYIFIMIFMACTMIKVQAKSIKNISDSKIIVAYVTSWSDVMPDPNAMTHINYAFGHVNKKCNAIEIDNPSRLKQIVKLKRQNPHLKIELSIGGWGSGGFSEMASSPIRRTMFAKDCHRIINEFNLDGIDIDWEYPTSNMANISASSQDTQNYTWLMHSIRRAIGNNKLLTLASAASAQYINFRDILPYIDFVNVMSYDMATAPKHHSPLYSSENSGSFTTDKSIKAHIEAGLPPSRIVMGMPLYGRGGKDYPNFQDFKDIKPSDEYTACWDSTAQVPYLTDKQGNFVFGYENAHSLSIKCQYILDNDLLGGMYWDYAGDTAQGDLRNIVAAKLMGKKHKPHVLILTERGGQHGAFTDTAIKWLNEEASRQHFALTEINNAQPITETFLNDFSTIIQLDFPPYTWPNYAQKAFEAYIQKGQGGWIGFHHATLLGEFDGYPMWNWFSNYMGGIRFKSYIAPLANGTVITEDNKHPVMKSVSSSFTVFDDEWYTYDKSPRPNVRVLASVDESTYQPDSSIKMGDHPVIWSNEKIKAHNIYFQFGHSPKLFQNENFITLFRNALTWTIKK